MLNAEQTVERNAIIGRIRDFIIDNFFFGTESITYTEEDSLMKKGIVDSTGILELVNFIEQEYDITVDDDELLPENLDSLNNLAGYISRKILR